MINTCLSRDLVHKPINPHAQRLLTAEARETQKLPKAKAKANAKVKAKAKAKADSSKGKKTDAQKEEESGVPRTEYAQAKKDFMANAEFLV